MTIFIIFYILSVQEFCRITQTNKETDEVIFRRGIQLSRQDQSFRTNRAMSIMRTHRLTVFGRKISCTRGRCIPESLVADDQCVFFLI